MAAQSRSRYRTRQEPRDGAVPGRTLGPRKGVPYSYCWALPQAPGAGAAAVDEQQPSPPAVMAPTGSDVPDVGVVVRPWTLLPRPKPKSMAACPGGLNS